MNKNKILLSALILISSGLSAKEYSFESAYERALNVDETALAAAKDVQKFKSERNAALGLYLPKIGVKGSYTQIDEPVVINLDSIRSAIQPLYPAGVTLPHFITTVQDDEFFKAQAFAYMPLFAGGKIIAANTAAKSNYEEALAKLDGIKNNILVETSTKYFGAMLATEVVKVREQFLKSSSQHASDAEKMFKAGTISKVEKMSAQIVLSQAQRDYNSAINDADISNTLLQNLLSEQESVAFSSSMFVTDMDKMETMAQFQASARRQNSVLKMIDAKLKLAGANVSAQRSGFMPNIYAFASHELYYEDLTLLDPQYAYGVGFEWNIFEGASTYNKTAAAKRQKESVDLLRQKHVKDIDTAVEFYYKKMQNALYRYKAVQHEIDFASEFYTARELGFKAGTTTSLEVNTAMAQRLKSELDSLSAQYDFVSSLANMLSVSAMTDRFEIYKQLSYQTEKRNENQFSK